MADKLIVGDPTCTYNKVIMSMHNSANFEHICVKWKKIAIDLEVPRDHIEFIASQEVYEGWTALDIMDYLLDTWKNIAGNTATLDVLLKIMMKHGLNDIVTEVLEMFSLTNDGVPTPGTPHQQPVFVPINPYCLPATQTTLMPAQLGSSLVAQYEPLQQLCQPGAAGVTYPISLIPNNIPAGNVLHKITDSGQQNLAKVSVNITKQPKREDDFYQLPGIEKGNGYALILNIIRYKNLGYRKGAQYDSIMLNQLFTQLGYIVFPYDDPNRFYTKDDLEKIVKSFRDSIKPKNPASVVVFIGCHGALEKIQLSDESFTSLFDSVVYQFDAENCADLNTVPKIFIIQSCRVLSHDGPGFKNIFHTIICYATLPGNMAARDEDSGTYYIKSLVKVFAEKAHKLNLTELLDETQEDLCKQPIQYRGISENRQQSMYAPIGQFKTFYFNF